MISCIAKKTFESQIPGAILVSQSNFPDLPVLQAFHREAIVNGLSNRKDVYLVRNDASTYLFVNVPENINVYQYKESLRRLGAAIANTCAKEKITTLQVTSSTHKEDLLMLAEGIMLASYVFEKYKSEKKNSSLKEVIIVSDEIRSHEVQELNLLVKAVYTARNLVNEPLSYLTATQLSEEIMQMGKEAGFRVEIYNKSKIQELKMGGLLAVNAGSPNPPTFTVMEYKPDNAVNARPYVLVGKGVVYDTGGLSLKPTENSMDYMKCDMAGAAAVACTIYAVAMNKLPIHVVGLVPATENRPDGNAIVPGDVITMHNGTTVEVLNTDAEGRLILGDALSYAQRYNPTLVIDIATLTGAAARAIGKEGSVYMSTAEDDTKKMLESTGMEVHERLVEFPLWQEYDEYIKSEIADIKNVGKAEAGAITAGMFLKHFISYPWIHIDIAGTAFLHTSDHYKTAGGTGVGVRLIYHFLKKISEKKS